MTPCRTGAAGLDEQQVAILDGWFVEFGARWRLTDTAIPAVGQTPPRSFVARRGGGPPGAASSHSRELSRCSAEAQFSAVEDEDDIAAHGCIVGLVRRHHDRRTLSELAQQRAQFEPLRGVEARRWLVEHDQRWRTEDRLGQTQTLPQPPAEGAHAVTSARRQPDTIEREPHFTSSRPGSRQPLSTDR